ncbi:MAG: hypothetical protein EA377_01670, partial [Phycisphaerales bacterium]
MRLAKVTLSGFKSFADTTEFRFDEPITGIVGPNGCGKSNVVDAIKWVLGERSAKSLRGDAMLDVIFAGSSSRKPVGAANVTLTFDNPVLEQSDDEADHVGRIESSHPHGRLLNFDAEQVDVARRLYRDGRSEYLINGKKVRLRDIKELFMDTGIGTHAYSIIEQGRVDAMLMANPIERRAILEEAAGVAKFKTRKVEASRKLERTEVNLVRVREQLANTERRLRIVKGQASKARRFQELDARYRELRVAMSLDTYHELRERLDGLTSRITDLDAKRKELLELVSTFEDKKQDAEIARHEVQGKQRELEQQRHELIANRKHADQRRELTERNLSETNENIKGDRTRLEETAKRLESLKQEFEDAENAIREAAEAVERTETRVSELNDGRAKRHETLMAASEALQELRESISRSEQRCNQLQSRIDSLESRIGTLREQTEKLTARRDEITNEQQQAEANKRETDARRGSAQQRVDELEARLDEHDRAAATLGERQAELSENLSDLRHERAARESRRHLLEEMQEAREGLDDAVKHILDRPEDFPGVRGLLADAIDTDREHAPLVEAALGGNLELLLFDRFDDLRSLDDSISHLQGRVRFLATRWLNEHDDAPTPPHAPIDPALGTPLLSYISVAPHAERAVSRLLSKTIVVSDLDAALMLAAGPLAGYRFVTRRGDLVEPDGRIVTGQSKASSAGDGWLTRRVELNELVTQIAGLDSRIEAITTELTGLNEESRQTQEQQ